MQCQRLDPMAPYGQIEGFDPESIGAIMVTNEAI